MITVNVTALRSRLPEFLGKVKAGQEVKVTSRGRVIARIVPEADVSRAARERLIAMRPKCRIGDAVSPICDSWDAAR